MGEVNALRPEDIDFDRKLLTVSRTISTGKDKKSFINSTTNLEYNGRHALRHTFATRCIESGIDALSSRISDNKILGLGMMNYAL
ncbi:MAG: hypothetical protein PUD12_04960 [Firmicutes bacterium]|nr:hypothetical protein [Bacillota bacterium]